MDEKFFLINDLIAITISDFGAELQSIKTRKGTELIWQARKNVWPRHAPTLFPIVGRLVNDQLVHQGIAHTLTQHGFARDHLFDNILLEHNQAWFRLVDNDDTLKYYPFSFEFIVRYILEQNTLHIDYVVRNQQKNELPFSLGGHPAFIYPIYPHADKDEHLIQFAKPETEKIWQLQAGLLHKKINSPLNDNNLELTPGLFDQDALIFTNLNSRTVNYGIKDKTALKIHFADFPDLGVWSKPNADFVCIEPWSGYASKTDYSGEFIEKEGIIRLPAYSERTWRYSIEVVTEDL